MTTRPEPTARAAKPPASGTDAQRRVNPLTPSQYLRPLGQSHLVERNPATVLQLQRLAGNRATVRALTATNTSARVPAASPVPPAPAPRNSPRAIQRKTELRFSNAVTGDSEITASSHTRGPVHGTAANWVLTNGEWGSVPDGTVVNHSKAYDPAAQHILDTYVHEQALSDAAKNVLAIHGELEAHNKGVGAPTSTHKSRLEAITDEPTDEVDVDNVVDSFNYYMYKICDYPNNLFVWPDRTGGDPDNPKGEFEHNYNDGTTMEDWVANTPGKTKKKRLADEKARVTTGRQELGNAIS